MKDLVVGLHPPLQKALYQVFLLAHPLPHQLESLVVPAAANAVKAVYQVVKVVPAVQSVALVLVAHYQACPQV